MDKITSTRRRKAATTTKTKKSKKSSVPKAPPREAMTWDEPTREEIEKRAYEIYLARGREHGSSSGDWLQAERELRAARAHPRGSSRGNA